MEKKQEIFASRKRLDNSLCLPALVNEDSITSLVKEQLIHSSLRNNRGDVGKIAESRTKEVANFLEMLRSASGSCSSHSKFLKDWKVKQDTDQLRVMYCEGPHGSPFHTLLAEGFADGPMDVCLCVSWELTLYKKWWPQYSVPTFKIIASSCLQKVRIGEEISLIRVKVPWPISDREAVLHYFEIEYFKEDLILILIKTLSDTELIDAETHGFSGDAIPQAKDTIRIDLVGGFVLQKVGTSRCYFRAIFNFDIKLDFIPPSLINFISRQLLGNGHKLYQKAIGSVAAIDTDYQEALQGPLYVRIRRQLYSHNRPATLLEDFDKEKLEEHTTDAIVKDQEFDTRTSVPEITEEDAEKRPDAGVQNVIVNGPSENLVLSEHPSSSKEKSAISPEVEHALDVLDQVITIVRGRNCYKASLGDDFSNSELPVKANLVKIGEVTESNNKIQLTNKSESEVRPLTDDHSSPALEVGHNETTLSYQKERISGLENSQLVESKVNPLSKAYVGATQPPISDTHSISKVCDEEILKADGFHNSGRMMKNKKWKNLVPCCMNPNFFKHDNSRLISSANHINKDSIE